MEFLIELILDLAFEGTLGLSADRRVPAWIRYPLIALLGLFFLAVIVLVLLIGILILKERWYLGIPVIALDVVFIVFTVRKFRKVYIDKEETWN